MIDAQECDAPPAAKQDLADLPQRLAALAELANQISDMIGEPEGEAAEPIAAAEG